MTKNKIKLALDRRTVRSLQLHEVQAVAGGMPSDTFPLPFTYLSVCRDCGISDEPAGC